jgi:hypothetical protein
MSTFIEKFNTYSNEELAGIIRDTSRYQPEAVTAAMHVLQERGIDAQAVTGSSQAPAPKAPPPAVKIPTPDWVILLMLVLAAAFAFIFYNCIVNIQMPWQKRMYYGSPLPTSWMLCILIPIALLLLVLRNTAGWIIAFGIMFMWVFVMALASLMSINWSSHNDNETVIYVSLVLYLIGCIVLHHKTMMLVFGVQRRHRDMGICTGVLFALLHTWFVFGT